MFEKAKSQSKKPSAWRNPNNLRYEGLRCIIALQANKPSVAVPFREDVVLCLRSADASLRLLAAEVLYNSCSADNLTGIADQVRAQYSSHSAGRANSGVVSLHQSRLHAAPASRAAATQSAWCLSQFGW